MINKEKIRDENAMPIVSGYTLWVFCCECMDAKDEVATEGKNCYSMARKIIRKRGWVLHKDGYATCGNCKNKSK